MTTAAGVFKVTRLRVWILASISSRVVHTASLWKPGERPLLRQQVIEGDPGLSI